MIDQPMHMLLKKGMLIGIKDSGKIKTALVVSDVYMLKGMFNMVDIISQGKKRKFRTLWVRCIYDETR
jgi:hypothetical protein